MGKNGSRPLKGLLSREKFLHGKKNKGAHLFIALRWKIGAVKAVQTMQMLLMADAES
jgi:hypothetical protein